MNPHMETPPMTDLIRRMDAIQACQVGPSDEWARATKDGYNQAATDCQRNILRIEPAPNAGAGKVKPLVWYKENERCWSAHWGFATYSVYLRDDGQYSMRMSWSLLMTDGYFAALEAAKAAAQSDYAARILAAIETTPDPRDAVIARLVEAMLELRLVVENINGEDYLDRELKRLSLIRIDDILAAAKEVMK